MYEGTSYYTARRKRLGSDEYELRPVVAPPAPTTKPRTFLEAAPAQADHIRRKAAMEASKRKRYISPTDERPRKRSHRSHRRSSGSTNPLFADSEVQNVAETVEDEDNNENDDQYDRDHEEQEQVKSEGEDEDEDDESRSSQDSDQEGTDDNSDIEEDDAESEAGDKEDEAEENGKDESGKAEITQERLGEVFESEEESTQENPREEFESETGLEDGPELEEEELLEGSSSSSEESSDSNEDSSGPGEESSGSYDKSGTASDLLLSMYHPSSILLPTHPTSSAKSPSKHTVLSTSQGQNLPKEGTPTPQLPRTSDPAFHNIYNDYKHA